jgi:hypothetical protein
MSSDKKVTWKATLPIPVLFHTWTGGGGGMLNQREKGRGNRGEYKSQSWVENTNMT